MFKETTETPEEYFASLEEPRKSELLELESLILETDSTLERKIWSGVVGYGQMNFTNAKGEKIPWFLFGLSSRKNYISFYVCSVQEGKYLAESYKPKLPKADIGRSCIRFRHLDDVDKDTLKLLIKEALAITAK